MRTFLGAARHVGHAIYMAKVRRHLKELPDYLLHDIGIHRSEIGSIASLGGLDETRRHRG